MDPKLPGTMATWELTSIARVRCQPGNPARTWERTTPIAESPALVTQLLNPTSQVVALRPERGSLGAKYDVSARKLSNHYDHSSGRSTMTKKDVTLNK
jgi:hypothetical protein